MGHGRTNQTWPGDSVAQDKHTFKRTLKTSLMPKKLRRLRSTLSAAELLRCGKFDEKIHWIASARGALELAPADALRWALLLVLVRIDAGGDGRCDWHRGYTAGFWYGMAGV